jgi:hypothetical protein
MKSADRQAFQEGFVMGLRAAAHMPNHEAIWREAKRIDALLEERDSGRVDGEAEWQSWMIELELQSWERDACRAEILRRAEHAHV